MSNPKLIFMTGGPDFHPVGQQADAIIGWLGEGFNCSKHEGVDAFDHLDGADLFVVMGLHWTGLNPDIPGAPVYRPMEQRHKDAFEQYVASGKPLLVHHGSIGSYDDWPRFGELLGFTWVWNSTQHSPIGDHKVRVLPTGHPVVAGVQDFDIFDELYYDVKLTDGVVREIHAEADWDGRSLPMVFTAHGGRIAGAGRAVYLANGHDMKAFEGPAMRKLWTNSVRWLLSQKAAPTPE